VKKSTFVILSEAKDLCSCS